MNIKKIADDIVADFSFLEDWTQRYEYLIDLGKSLPMIDEKHKTDKNLITGCQSKVWLFAESKEHFLVFTADSDAILTKGIIALLLQVFNGQTASEIIDFKPDFLEKIQLKEHLSPNRANGLAAMVNQIKLYAVALKAKQNV